MVAEKSFTSHLSLLTFRSSLCTVHFSQVVDRESVGPPSYLCISLSLFPDVTVRLSSPDVLCQGLGFIIRSSLEMYVFSKVFKGFYYKIFRLL